QLPLLGQEHDLITIMKRTAAHELLDNSYTMEVFIESEDRPGLTEKFTKFFADQQIGLDSLSAQTISKSKIQLDSDQFHIAITPSVSADFNLMQLQEDFDERCKSLNVQGSLNSIKNTRSSKGNQTEYADSRLASASLLFARPRRKYRFS
ncbi:hypothetical protein JGD21_25320, partial [Salmonella enterica subsp. enterica serovar Typhimurium]|nr:hypothetical protein [Salmonella enterica subsp. enterica serovar Typhimurium]